MDETEFLTSFWAKDGEPMPQVDSEDVKAVWKVGQEVKRDHPGVNVV